MLRDRIIRSSIKRINLRGSKFTMDDIAKDVGISKRTLYEVFSSKEHLIESIIDDILEKIDDKDRVIAADTSLSSVEKIRQIGLVIVEEIRYIDESAIYDVAKYYPKIYDKVDEWLAGRAGLQEEILESGVKSGEIREINKAVFLKILNSSKGWLLDKSFLADNNLTIAEGVKSLLDLVLLGITK